jgi:hypothetical protein
MSTREENARFEMAEDKHRDSVMDLIKRVTNDNQAALAALQEALERLTLEEIAEIEDYLDSEDF